MAVEDNNQQTQQTEQAPGNSPDARNPDGSLKDQTQTQQSGDQSQKTNTDGSPKPDAKSFLNRTPEAKPEASAEPEAKPEDKKPEGEDKPVGAPEKYEDFKLPEGQTLDPELTKAATAIFKDLNLPQEGAQKLVDFYAENFVKAAEAPYKLWADTQSGWVDKIISDFGQARAETMRTDINKGIEAAFPPKLQTAFREAIDLTGAGSNPAMFEAFHTLFKPFLEGQPVKGGGPTKESQTAPKADSRPSVAHALYPHLVGNVQE